MFGRVVRVGRRDREVVYHSRRHHSRGPRGCPAPRDTACSQSGRGANMRDESIAGRAVNNEPMSPRVIQAVQLLAGVSMAVFIGARFMPPRYRHPAGRIVTVCYVVGIVAFVAYAIFR